MGGQAMGSGMSVVVDNEFCGKWRPVVIVKNSAAKELDKPGPPGVFVIVTGYVEAEPGATVFHISLEGCALLVCVGEVVEPEHNLVVAETGVQFSQLVVVSKVKPPRAARAE